MTPATASIPDFNTAPPTMSSPARSLPSSLQKHYRVCWCVWEVLVHVLFYWQFWKGHVLQRWHTLGFHQAEQDVLLSAPWHIGSNLTAISQASGSEMNVSISLSLTRRISWYVISDIAPISDVRRLSLSEQCGKLLQIAKIRRSISSRHFPMSIAHVPKPSLLPSTSIFYPTKKWKEIHSFLKHASDCSEPLRSWNNCILECNVFMNAQKIQEPI